MKRLALSLVLFAVAAIVSARGIVAGNSYCDFFNGYYLTPVRLATSNGFMMVACSIAQASNGAFYEGAVLTLANEGVGGIGGTTPVDFVNNETPYNTVNPDAGTDLRIVGNQPTANGIKVRYLESASGEYFTGNPTYEYTSDGSENDQALKLGTCPYASYTAVSLGNGNSSELGILYAAASGPTPVVEITDPDLSPTIGAQYTGQTLATFAVTAPSDWRNPPPYIDNQFLVSGKDNLAGVHGGSRASAYKVNGDGSVSIAFSQSFPNTLANGIFSYHDIRVAASSGAFSVIVDNQVSYNAAKQYTYNYVLHAYDGAGNQLWQSNPHMGQVANISIGTPGNIYVLTTRDPNQDLVQYDSTHGSSNPTWTTACNATYLCNAFNQGVIYALNTANTSGYRHVTIIKLDQNGNRIYTVSYASQPTNNDIVSELRWMDGQVYVVGQCIDSSGKKGIFGAQWHQVAGSG